MWLHMAIITIYTITCVFLMFGHVFGVPQIQVQTFQNQSRHKKVQAPKYKSRHQQYMSKHPKYICVSAYDNI